MSEDLLARLSFLQSEVERLRRGLNSMQDEVPGTGEMLPSKFVHDGDNLPAPTEDYQVLTADLSGWSGKAPEDIVAWVPDVVRATATDAP